MLLTTSAVRRRGIILGGTLAVVLLLLSGVVVEDAQAVFGCGFSLSTPLCLAGKAGGTVVGSLASDAITSLAQAVMKWVVQLLQELATVWVGITPPALTDSSGNATGTVAWLQGHLALLTGALAMVSIFVGSFKIAIEERPAAHFRQLVKYLFTFVLVSGSAAAFVGMSIAASDALATWMIHNAIGQATFAHKIGMLLGVTVQGAPPVGFAATAAVAFATIVLGILACLAMIAQVMIMLLRGAMLIALVGTLPAAAAASNTEVGLMWFRKQVAWVIAWAAYPLAAAVIYSAAFLLPGQGGLDALLSGVLLLIAAVVALPVLIRFLVPMTSSVSGGSGIGQIAAEGAAAAMLMRGLPTGAAEVNDDSTGQQTGGSGGGEGSSGAPSGAAAVGGDEGSTGGSAAGNGSGGAGAGVAEGAGAGSGGAGAAAGVGAAVQMGMDATRSVGESSAEGVDDGSPGGGPMGGSGGANGSGSAAGANGSSSADGSVGDAAGTTGAAAGAGYGDSRSGGGPAGAGPAAGGAGGGVYAADGPPGSEAAGGGGSADGGSGGTGEGPSGAGGAAGPSGA